MINNNRRIVLVAQYWQGDRDVAMRNVRRIVDNEPAPRTDFEICFVARFDCQHDQATIDYAAKKFHVSTYTGSRRGTGWPFGCNDLVCDIFQESYRRLRNGQWAQVRAIFLMEGDCVPVHRDWLNRLSAEWTATERIGKWLTGWWIEHSSPVGHINGNMLIHPNIAHFLPQLIGCPAAKAWDCAFAPLFQPHWRKANFMENLYAQRGIPRAQIEDIVKSGVVVIHGVKDMTVEDYADSVLRKHPTS